MIKLPDDLEEQIVAHETTCIDAAGARAVLEESLLMQMRAIADGLLASILRRGESFGGHSWWNQFLSRKQLPAKYLPDLKSAEFLEYRRDFAQRVASSRLLKIAVNTLPEVQVRILGGHCHFSDEGRINRQLARLGSSLRLIVVGSSRLRTAQIKRMFAQQANERVSLDGRFLFGSIGPASVFGGSAALYIFEREFAVSPYMEAGANGFTDEARIAIRQDVLRADVEEQIEQFESEKTAGAITDETGEEPIPFTVAHGELRKALRSRDGSLPDAEELLHKMTMSVLTHELAHVAFSGACISHGTSPVKTWKQGVREDLLRFAQQPRTLDEFRAVFRDYFPEGGLMLRFGPAFGLPTREDGSLETELEALLSDGLLFVAHDNRYYSKLYGRGERWSL